MALENSGKPIVLGVLSSAVSASAGTERGSNGRDRQDDEKGRGSERGRNEHFKNQEIQIKALRWDIRNTSGQSFL